MLLVIASGSLVSPGWRRDFVGSAAGDDVFANRYGTVLVLKVLCTARRALQCLPATESDCQDSELYAVNSTTTTDSFLGRRHVRNRARSKVRGSLLCSALETLLSVAHPAFMEPKER